MYNTKNYGVQINTAKIKETDIQIHINDIDEKERKKDKKIYSCLGCDGTLIPCIGPIRPRYFRHEKPCQCDGIDKRIKAKAIEAEEEKQKELDDQYRMRCERKREAQELKMREYEKLKQLNMREYEKLKQLKLREYVKLKEEKEKQEEIERLEKEEQERLAKIIKIKTDKEEREKQIIANQEKMKRDEEGRIKLEAYIKFIYERDGIPSA